MHSAKTLFITRVAAPRVGNRRVVTGERRCANAASVLREGSAVAMIQARPQARVRAAGRAGGQRWGRRAH